MSTKLKFAAPEHITQRDVFGIPFATTASTPSEYDARTDDDLDSALPQDTALLAYDYICKLAVEHALILNASGGITTIVHPDTQRAAGLYEHIQWVHGLGKHPDTIKMEATS